MQADRIELIRARLEAMAQSGAGDNERTRMRRRLSLEIALPMLELWADAEQGDDFDPFEAAALSLTVVIDLVKELLVSEFEGEDPAHVYCVVKRYLDNYFPSEAARAGTFHVSSQLH